MSRECACQQQHRHRRIVLTGGPGAGKTAVLELLRHSLCSHLTIVPEAASIVFGGGFPRNTDERSRRAAQRAIYRVQLELEEVADASAAGIHLCDRGAIDGAAYWVGNDSLWDAVGMSRADALRRYDAVIHLRVPGDAAGYGHQNPLRLETAIEARRIDDLILAAWSGHPRRTVIQAAADFLEKTRQALDAARRELPLCCRNHVDEVGTASQEGQNVLAS